MKNSTGTRRRALVLSVFVFIFLFFSCSDDDEGDEYSFQKCDDIAEQVTADTSSALTINGTRWLYQLQDIVAAEVAASRFDTVVMDYSSDGGDDGAFSEQDISLIKSSTPEKQALAYVSIGEAEDYRYYFNSSWLGDGGQPGGDAPCWLNRTNPHWQGNYKVQYWSEEWQQIVLAYIDRIIDAGFDGVYLDIIDAYEYWSDNENDEGYYIGEEDAAARMINFVRRIARHARVTRGEPGFLIIPQNGEKILKHDRAGKYLETINGIGIEDLYYDETAAIDSEVTAGRKEYLDMIKNAGKKVIVVDYVDTGNQGTAVSDFLSRAAADGFCPYAAITDRELNEIHIFTGQP